MDPTLNSYRVNYAEDDGSGVTRCRAYEEADKQKTCKYYRPASHANRCMHLHFGVYCDNSLAYREAKGLPG